MPTEIDGYVVIVFVTFMQNEKVNTVTYFYEFPTHTNMTDIAIKQFEEDYNKVFFTAIQMRMQHSYYLTHRKVFKDGNNIAIGKAYAESVKKPEKE